MLTLVYLQGIIVKAEGEGRLDMAPDHVLFREPWWVQSYFVRKLFISAWRGGGRVGWE
jgi:hypothetical protein